MKRHILIAGVATLSLAVAGGAVLAHGKKGGMQGARGMMQGGPMIDFKAADTNGDGKLTQDELKAHAKARFDAADTDGNGKLSADEMKAAAMKRAEERRAQRAERMTARMIERMDADDDGELSFDEMPGQKDGTSRMFERLDADGDGALSLEEMETARERFAGRHGEGRGHGEGHKQHRKGWHDAD